MIKEPPDSTYRFWLASCVEAFLRGASHPEELVDRAKAQSYAALALTDECSLAGVVRAHLQAKATGLPLLIGAQFGLHGLFGHPHTAVEPASQRPAGGPPDAKDGRTQNTRAAPARRAGGGAATAERASCSGGGGER